jgi:hypothetical protein
MDYLYNNLKGKLKLFFTLLILSFKYEGNNQSINILFSHHIFMIDLMALP